MDVVHAQVLIVSLQLSKGGLPVAYHKQHHSPYTPDAQATGWLSSPPPLHPPRKFTSHEELYLSFLTYLALYVLDWMTSWSSSM